VLSLYLDTGRASFAPQTVAKFTYALEQEMAVTTPTVRYTAGEVTVLIPASQATTWCLTDQVGIVERIRLGAVGSLDLLIEKDFACLDGSDEDNQDTFVNPHTGAAC
jgi:hypothetical protein